MSYGAVCESDIELIEFSLDLLCDKYFKGVYGEILRLAEVGVETGDTARGIKEYILNKGVKDFEYYCIEKRLIVPPFTEARMIYGDSAESWTEFNKQLHWLFIDGCHCVNHLMLDFLNWGSFIVTGGYVFFHDVKENYNYLPSFYCGHGPKDNKLFYVGVREGLRRLGLLDGFRKDWIFIREIISEKDNIGSSALFEKIVV